jgi:predicted dehydrogenase
MRLRTYPGAPSWWEPFDSATVAVERADPLAAQIAHFAEVIRGEAAPVCTGRDGLDTVKVVDAVVVSARTGRPVEV